MQAMSRLQVIKGGGGETLGMGLADYIWVTDQGHIVCKKKTILVGKDEKGESVPLIQRWNYAACGCFNECEAPSGHPCPHPQTLVLAPAFYLPDPTRPQPCYIVLCESRDGQDKAFGLRSHLRKALAARGPAAKLVWFGFEQQYRLEPLDQGSQDLAERQFLTSERHMGACFDAGIMLHSVRNQPSSPRPAEFKVGVRNFPQDHDPDPPSALVISDHLVIAQYLMEKIGAEKGLNPQWLQQSLFVSTAELRELGGNQRRQAALLGSKFKDPRWVPHPTNGGCMCMEISPGQSQNPYQRALTVLEAVWPLEVDLQAEAEEGEDE